LVKRSDKLVVIAGAIIGAAVGTLGSLAYLRWGAVIRDHLASQRPATAPAKPLNLKQVTQVGLLGLQLARELTQLIRRG
jgi:hypothetical protein